MPCRSVDRIDGSILFVFGSSQHLDSSDGIDRVGQELSHDGIGLRDEPFQEEAAIRLQEDCFQNIITSKVDCTVWNDTDN